MFTSRNVQLLNLANTTVLSEGQQNPFFNGTIKVSSIQTVYSPPNVGNIKLLVKANWTATTYINLVSTYKEPIFVGTTFFEALNINPSDVAAYQWITTKRVANVIISTKIIQTQVSTPNGIIIVNITNQTNAPEVQIGGYWQPLNNNDAIIAPGNNQFMIVGKGSPRTTYNWTFEFSTANAVAPSAITGNLTVGNTTITPQSVSNYNFAKISNLPITTIDIDPSWSIPSGILEFFNLSIKNNDPTNSLAAGTAINYTFNAIAYNAYANNAFTNWEIFNGYTGNILYSWMEGNTAMFSSTGNEFQTYGLNTVNSLTIWVKLDSSIASSTNDVNGIAIGFLTMSTNAMNGNNVGYRFDTFDGVISTYTAYNTIAQYEDFYLAPSARNSIVNYLPQDTNMHIGFGGLQSAGGTDFVDWVGTRDGPITSNGVNSNIIINPVKVTYNSIVNVDV